MRAILQKLGTDSWRTSGARFNAARRLKRREFVANVSLALMSALTVIAAFVQRVYAEPSSNADNYLSVVSAGLGVVLLVISLIEWGTKSGNVAENLHQSAEKLNAFRRKIAIQIAVLDEGGTVAAAEVQLLTDEYFEIKAECPYNHAPHDDAYFRIFHPNEPGFPHPSLIVALWIRLVWHLSSVLYVTVLWAFLLCLAFPLKEPCFWTAVKAACH
ncbi:hypothetical protein C798_00570 [Herbaspirillum rubrisubalbicans Os34]|uniref:SMODS and SLOG-associating 2TM effector domain-containing protein n=1 Tax=Herbaspirillum rubrisubalbicans Os34 TaxID=1235827 RepID=A0A6M3ZJD2_9BURK|nr:SLATT domain-containing protein [Herbaspirillum rubrisubalbicans]QJP98776.1 hypothetical protein C798_00570 [Herbaspirillum rubrisubalbicans Os34]